jgi:hypothetical protein
VGPRDFSAGTTVDQARLEAAIKSEQDVEKANKQLYFITYLRSDILFTYEMTRSSGHLQSFRQLHDQVVQAVEKLDKWSGQDSSWGGGLGGSTAMPNAYQSIRDWISSRQGDQKSVYSCL